MDPHLVDTLRPPTVEEGGMGEELCTACLILCFCVVRAQESHFETSSSIPSHAKAPSVLLYKLRAEDRHFVGRENQGKLKENRHTYTRLNTSSVKSIPYKNRLRNKCLR